MKAVLYTSTGQADAVLELGELPTPRPATGELLVRLEASGVNPSDVKARAGLRVGASGMPYPCIVPHSDGAGVVEAVGEGLDASWVGQSVWLCNGQWQRAFGTAAEYIAIDASLVFPLPENCSAVEGAALGIPALTAAHCVFADGDVNGQSILINGGAGTVGYLAVQMAAAAGATVIATASPSKAQKLLDAGASKVLDYRSDTLAADILEANSGQPVDRIVEVEFGLNADTDAEVIKPRGTVAAYGSAQCIRPELPFYGFMFKGVKLDMVLVYSLNGQERADAAERVNRALSKGDLTLPIHATYPLHDCAAAHQVVESGDRNGAVIVEIN
ncbi:MAG: NADPH:quinone reductase [Granulosicoccaceae bacterium]